MKLPPRSAAPLIAALFVLCLICDFAIARSLRPNADSVQNFNELNSIFSGNLLLSHWVIASDSFYLTDLPFYVLFRSIAGNTLWLIYAVPFTVYALLLAAALFLVLTAPPRKAGQIAGAAALFCLIGIPASPFLFMLLVSDFHAATIMFCLLAICFAAPALAGQTMRPIRFAACGLSAFIASASDPMANMFFLLPLLGYIAILPLLRRRLGKPHVVLAGCTLAAFVCASMFPGFLELHGGFYSRPSYSNQPVSHIGQFSANIRAIWGALAVLFELRGAALPLSPLHLLVRALAAGLVLLSTLRTLLRLSRDADSAVAQLLVLCALCLCAACSLSTSFSSAITPGPGYPNAATRYVAPAYIFFCIAASIEVKSFLAAYRPRYTIFAGAAGAAVLFSVGLLSCLPRLAAPAGIYTSPAYQLSEWLQAQHLTYGVGDYYTTQLVRALSREAVMADPMTVANLRLIPDRFWTDTTRLDSHLAPQFVIFPTPNWFGLTRADAIRTYGPPVSETRRDGVTILLYRP